MIELNLFIFIQKMKTQFSFLGFSGEKFVFPGLFGWISKNKFFFLTKKVFSCYMIKKKNSSLEKLFPFKKIKLESEISFFWMSPKKKILLITTKEGGLFMRSFYSFENSRLFFSNSQILKFQSDFFRSDLIYLISKKHNLERRSNLVFPLFFLQVFNIAEKKSFPIYKFKQTKHSGFSLHFIKKKNLLISTDNNTLIFFFIDWKKKKVFIKKYIHDSVISSLLLFRNYVLVSDQNGFFTFFKHLMSRKMQFHNSEPAKNLISFRLFQKKAKLAINGFSILSHLRGLSFVIYIKGDNKIICINSRKIKLKKFVLFPEKKEIFDIQKNYWTKFFLGVSRTNEFFLFNLAENSRLKITNYFEMPLLIKKKGCDKNFPTFKFEIFHIPSLGREIFFVSGLQNFFHLFNLKTIASINSFSIERGNQLNFKGGASDNLVFCNSSLTSLIFFFKKSIFKISISPRILSEFNFFDWQINIKREKKNISRRRNEKFFSFLRGKKLVIVRISEIYIKTYGCSYSSKISRPKEENVLFFKKNCSSVNFSPKGNFLITFTHPSLTLWKIHPTLKKLKTVSLEISGKVNKISFLSNKNYKLVSVSSPKELMILNLDNDRINFNLKLQILGIEIDQIGERFLLNTRFFIFPELWISPAVIIFKIDSTVPIGIINLEILKERCLLALNFFKQKRKTRMNKKLILLDSFFEVYKIIY